jgi:uncharacterized iron-regulated membrane protein
VIVIFHFLPMFNQVPVVKSASQTPLVALNKLLQKADVAIPEGKTTSIELAENQPQKLTVRKRLPAQETGRFDLSTVELDRYSGEVLQVNKVVKPAPLFKFMVGIAGFHFGSFGGLPTRLLYEFVGLMPTVLFITGLVNWRRRQCLGGRRQSALQLAQETQKTRLP